MGIVYHIKESFRNYRPAVLIDIYTKNKRTVRYKDLNSTQQLMFRHISKANLVPRIYTF